MAACLCVAVYFVSRSAVGARPANRNLQGLPKSALGLMTPVIILGGIYAGITPTEAAAAAIFYGLIVGLFVTVQ